MTELRRFHLKVISSLSINISAGFMILALTTKDMRVLTSEILFVIVFTMVSLKIEEILEDYNDKF